VLTYFNLVLNMGFIKNSLKSSFIVICSLFFLFSLENAYAKKELRGFEIGSPDAPITIIEYRSLTCSHCADFANNVFPELNEKYIQTGKVKFEFRPFVLNAVDLNAFKLLLSIEEKDFLSLDKMLFRDQNKWLVTKDSNKILENSTNALKKYALLYGLSEETFNDILNDKELEEWILSMRVDGTKKFNIQATPSFVINGEVHSGNMPFSKFEKLLN
jgi:protein-disulfide isomerase